jgi:PH (Pleckstrin Homology) domain-containing protein
VGASRLFRVRGHGIGIGIWGALAFALGVGMGVVATDRPWLVRVLAASAGVLFGWLALRGARARVEPTDSGIKVVNVFRTRPLPWDEMEAVALERYGFFPAIAVFHLKDCGRVPAFAIEAPNPLFVRKTPPDVTAIIGDLNRLIESRQEA